MSDFARIHGPDQGAHAELIADCARKANLSRHWRSKLRDYALSANVTTYGSDYFAGCGCPLVMVGAKRPWFPSGAQWFVSARGETIPGSREFTRLYDEGMAKLVGLPGPAMVGIFQRPPAGEAGDPAPRRRPPAGERQER